MEKKSATHPESQVLEVSPDNKLVADYLAQHPALMPLLDAFLSEAVKTQAVFSP